PPATTTPATDPKAAETKKAPAVDLSLPPSLPPSIPTVAGGTNLTTKEAETLTPTTSGGGASEEWKFTFHGYLRAPLRASWGPPSPTNPPSGNTSDFPMGAVPPYEPGAAPPPGTQLHAAPRVPGYLYTNWEFTNTLGGPWTELAFSFGTSRVTATVIVNSWN